MRPKPTTAPARASRQRRRSSFSCRVPKAATPAAGGCPASVRRCADCRRRALVLALRKLRPGLVRIVPRGPQFLVVVMRKLPLGHLADQWSLVRIDGEALTVRYLVSRRFLPFHSFFTCRRHPHSRPT